MLDDETVVRLLLRAKVLTPFRVNQARRLQRQTGAPLYDVLLEHGLVEERVLLQAIGAVTPMPCVSLRGFGGDPRLIERLPRELAETHRVLPIGLMTDGEKERLCLAMVDPTDLVAMEAVSQETSYDVEPVLVGPTDLRSAVARIYGLYEAGAAQREEGGVDLDGSEDLPGLGEWDHVALDGESDEFLRDLLDDSSEPTDRLEAVPQPIRQRWVSASDRDSQADASASPPPSERGGMASNVFREFMNRSSVTILSPQAPGGVLPRSDRQVGSLDLIRVVLRLLIRHGIISEKELLEELVELRRRRTRDET